MQAFAYRDKALLCNIPRRLSTLQPIQGVQEIALLPVSKQGIERFNFSPLALDNEPFVETAFFYVAHRVYPYI